MMRIPWIACSDCTEHIELEAKIEQCVQLLYEISKRAALVARKSDSRSLEIFRLLLAENACMTSRLEALREALRMHRKVHGCPEAVPIRFAAAPARRTRFPAPQGC